MFRIGEFSKIAQVSGRLLRYYNEIGLLKPVHIDSDTGYRFYSADQLPRLNRILALKELGLSLEQIARLLDDDISATEIRGMLTMQKLQIEQSLRDDLARLQQVELRLNQIEEAGHPWTPDVILKSVPALPILSYREQTSFTAVNPLMNTLFQPALPTRQKTNVGLPLFVLYSDELDEEHADLELGFQLKHAAKRPLSITTNDSANTPYELTPHILSAVPLMATLIHKGWGNGAKSYNMLGQWIEANGYKMNGPSREVILAIDWPQNPQETMYEIQFPVTEINK